MISLVLENNQKINRALFSHITDERLSAIAEVIYNVFCLPMSVKKKKKFQQNLKVLKKFINEKDKRREILVRNYKLFSDLLTTIKKYIQILLE